MTGRGARGAGGAGPARQESVNEQLKFDNPPAHYSKLRGADNWLSWKGLMVLFFQTLRLGHLVTTRPAEADLDDEASPVAQADRHLQMCIGSYVHESLARLVTGPRIKCAYDAWTSLCTAFENQGVQRRLTLLYKFLDTKRAAFNSLSEFVDSVQETFDLLSGGGASSLSEEVAAAIVLRNLRTEDEMVKRFVEQSCTVERAGEEPTLSFDLVLQKLRLEGQKEMAEALANGGVALKAFHGASKGSFRGRGRGGRGGRGGHTGHGDRGGHQNNGHRDNKNQGQQNDDPKDYAPCRWCASVKHHEDNCWYKYGRKRRNDQQRARGHFKRGASRGPGNWAMVAAKDGTSKQDGAAKMAKRTTAEALLAGAESGLNA